ncbi:hypothetical protein HK100_003929 [Physocladia obscura]|uniref:Protein kinase domain-containing protein n=1 Tax=Physocladia obscura TaxID=109957 RepID=A0AAD5SWE2_9FUNG|nr:hypothetical protein HK100_003929 [Physocladia obscura]
MGAEASTVERKPLAAQVNIDLRDFNLLKVVGKGAFGKVRIVQKKSTGVLYALKYINKLQTIRMRAIQNIFRERCILEDINHPLIVNLRYAFQDDFHMFMVIDLMEGGDLRFHLDKHHGFSEQIIRSWASEVAVAIAYLHSKNILHRDLKPDNVLLDAQGHAHLTDFNIAVNFSDKRMLKSHSGTLAYMAPDILYDKGYMWQIDWFSFGVILYELFYGKRPFRAATNNELAKIIKAGKFTFHDCNQVTKQPIRITSAFRNFLERLMDIDRTTRLGCGSGGSGEVMSHLFFEGVNWADVENKRTRPSFVPDVSKSNFETSIEKDEMIADDAYLQYRPKMRENRTALTQEILNNSNTAAATAAAIPALKQPASLANFLGASSIPTTDNSNNQQQPAPKILEVTQILGLAQIKDFKETGPKASNTERIEAELDFIDENYDPYDWEVAQRYYEQQRLLALMQVEQSSRGLQEGSGNRASFDWIKGNGGNGMSEILGGGGFRSNSLPRARSIGNLRQGGGGGGNNNNVSKTPGSGRSGMDIRQNGNSPLMPAALTAAPTQGGVAGSTQVFFEKVRRKSVGAIGGRLGGRTVAAVSTIYDDGQKEIQYQPPQPSRSPFGLKVGRKH